MGGATRRDNLNSSHLQPRVSRYKRRSSITDGHMMEVRR